MSINNKLFLSICISIHNTEEFILRCLSSIKNQDLPYDLYEIIIVNNGSTDNSLQIINNFKKNNEMLNIKIFSQEDKGLAQGRVTGIKNSKGRFITFLDADDFINNELYFKCYNYLMQNDVDILEFGTIHGIKKITPPFNHIINADVYLKNFFKGNKDIYTMLWMRVYKRELFDKMPFPNIYMNNEDIFAFPCLLFNAKKIGFIQEVLHTYSIDNDQSVMNKVYSTRINIDKIYSNRLKTLKSLPFIERYLDKDIDSFKEEYCEYKANFIIGYLFTELKNVSFNKKISDVCDELNFNTNKEVYKFIKKNIKIRGTTQFFIKFFGVRNIYFIRLMFKKIKGRRK